MGTATLERNGVKYLRLPFLIHLVCLVSVLTAFNVFASGETASLPVSADSTSVIIVVGAPGEAEFGTNFLQQAQQWENCCDRAKCRHQTIGLASGATTNDFALLKSALASEPRSGPGQLWLVFIGHGTFDGKEARFNLRGPDVSATDLATWLKDITRPLAVINCASCSAPFINKLSGTNRVIITATRSGHEQNYARFGEYFADAIGSLNADLDKDGEVSLLEAFLMASLRTAEFYKLDGRIATEHALLDDNGDGLGTPPDWFHGVRVTTKPKNDAIPDGLLANQFRLVPGAVQSSLTPAQKAQLDALEREVILWRERKEKVPEAEYYSELEKRLLALARASSTNSVPAPNQP
jgi:hypothetical protein